MDTEKKIKWSVDVQVVGGVKISASQVLSVDATDDVVVSVPDTADKQEVNVQPGDAGNVKFIMITADPYAALLTYSTKADGSDPVKLDAAQILVGEGAVGLFGATPPQKLYFSNTTGADASVRILVGREATA